MQQKFTPRPSACSYPFRVTKVLPFSSDRSIRAYASQIWNVPTRSE